MADISGTAIFEEKASLYGYPVDDEVFQNAYMRSVNRCLNRLRILSNASTSITEIDDTEEDIPLDEDYEYILVLGIDYHLLQQGFKPRSPGANDAITLRSAKADWEQGIDEYLTEIAHDNQDSDEADDIDVLSNIVVT